MHWMMAPRDTPNDQDLWLQFGDAGLNFGDCFSYGTANLSATRLLFMGEDVARTDVGRVLG